MNELHPLGKLIQDAQDKHGWSTRDLEREAERHGHSMKHSNFSRLKLEPVIAIKATQIEILAKVLRCSRQTVATAAIASMGVDLEAPSGRLEDAIRSSQEINSRDRQILLSVVNVMRDDESGTTIGNQQPGNPEPSTPRLRAVEPNPDHLGKEQKTDDAEYTITEIHGAETSKYPVPPIEQLAAHPKVKTVREQLDETTGEREDSETDVD